MMPRFALGLRLVIASVLAAMLTIPDAGVARADYVRDHQWHLGFLHIAEAQRLSQGHGVVVGLVDTGVDASHPDLADAVEAGVDLSGTAADGRHDSDGHGTHLAGLIAARGRPGNVGALGIAPQASILPVKIALGLAASQGLRGLTWAVDHGAKVVCFATNASSDGDLDAAVAYAQAADVVIVAAAGNSPREFDMLPLARKPGVLAVGGINQDGIRDPVSVSGTQMGLVAPAIDVVSTGIGGRYRTGTGTSDSAAIVAGVAALVRSKYPTLSAPEVIHRLTATAIDKGLPGRDEEYGYGIVDPVAALTREVPPASQDVSSTHPPVGGTRQPMPKSDHSTVFIGQLLTGLLIAAAGVGVVIAMRRSRTDRNLTP
jgi:type VII secretion-associated serine protease mycosin